MGLNTKPETRNPRYCGDQSVIPDLIENGFEKSILPKCADHMVTPPETRNPKPETRNPKPEPETRNPKPEPETRNPKPETLSPKP
ncbi:hypothetical protein T484DRAFT_3507633 [Baffinella frigidus]|nr:hypothetical protein T484DRAFT_3507633 [Cryptophyta sp. CCMP2293]